MINYHSITDIRARLESPALAGCTVVLVDNDSEPGEISALGKRHNAEVLLSDENLGFAGGVNLGMAHLNKTGFRGPILLLNPDVALRPGDLDTLLDKLGEGRAGVGPLLMLPTGQLQIGAGGASLGLRSVIFYFLFLSHVFPFLRGVFLTRRQARRGGRVGWLCGGCLLLASDVVSRYGLWPEDEIVYGEDVVWGSRATALGARFELIPEVTVLHHAGSSGGSAAWSGALERWCGRCMPSVAATFAVYSIRVGLATRRALGRVIP
jgi:GT2 family glycosyltransferase